MPRGGFRQGAGRPKGTGAWGEATRPLRVPESLYTDVQAYIEAGGCPRLPLYSSNVPAGTPGVADDHVEEFIDLNALLVKHPEDTFMLRVSGDSMTGAGIFDGDLLIVDRKEIPRKGRIVVANIKGQPTVKTFQQDKSGKITLMPENDAYSSIPVTKSDDFAVLGCVVGAVKCFRL
ncbi:MAG: LexA family transcriptional regulator [Proteobacteria bacterium]|nr:LexA family transcriptional regulator [Pseudomonadota bacterium]